MITVPTSTHYALADVVLDEAQIGSHKEFPVPSSVDHVRGFHIKALQQASEDLHFTETFFSLRLASNLSSHDKDPFVHVWTSLIDQGTGPIDLALREKHLHEEANPEIAFASADAGERYEQLRAFLKDMEDKRAYIQDGTIQVPLKDFMRDEDTLVSDFSHFTLFFPRAFQSGTPSVRTHPTRFAFDKSYPADAAVHFQVHSNIESSDGKAAYGLTGTGMISMAEIGARVRAFLASPRAQEQGSVSDGTTTGLEMPPIEIPLILNAVSSQEPDAKMIDRVVPSREPVEPAARGEALYEGSLFLYVQIADPATRAFFTSDLSFARPSTGDVTRGNFSHIAASMKMHVMRDMFPFIDKFTQGIATVTERDDRGAVVGTRTWAFEPSLPEGKNIHAPFNKVNTHTLPGFTYYHDRAMQRLPTAPFILNTTRIVLGRRGMSEEDFVKHANNPVFRSDKKGDSPSTSFDINPKFVEVLRIVGEIATAFPTSMTYRGDYADMNTEAVDNYPDLVTSADAIHHAEHASGMTRRASGTHSHTRYYQRWEETLKTGTEMFGDAMMDRSGDCEDFAKLISRMVAGMYSVKSEHPTIRSIQSVLDRYVPFSNLSSVTSASIRTAPSDEGGGSSEGKLIGETIVGSRQDLNAPIGAHMFSSLLNKQEFLRGIQKTSSRVEHLPDGSELDKMDRMEISQNVLHKSLWVAGKEETPLLGEEEEAVGEHRGRVLSILRRGKESSSSTVHDDAEVFVRKWTPPLILEGTGQSNALVNAISSYYTRLEDKTQSINETLLHVEALTRLISSVSTADVTSEDIQANQAVFAPFFMPIDNKRLIDNSPDVRISPFYRMITEMYAIPAGGTDVRVTPSGLARAQTLYNREKDLTGLDLSSSSTPKVSSKASLYGTGRGDEDDSIYAIDRIIPVQLDVRRLSSERSAMAGKHEEGGRNLTYGVNLTDFAHASPNVGMIRMVKTLPSEQDIINAVMVHTAPTMSMELPPRAEVQKAKRMAERYEKMLMTMKQGEGSVVTRERYAEIPDRPISLYARTDWIQDGHIKALGAYLAGNKYTDKITVTPESFARGHHLLRITVHMIVAGTKQLYLDSNTLTERLTSQAKMDDVLREGLEGLFSQ